MAAELALSAINEHRLGRAGRALESRSPARLFRAAKWCVWTGLALRLRRRGGPLADHPPSVCHLAGGLGFRYAWVAAGRASATDDEGVAAAARAAVTATAPGAGPAGSSNVARGGAGR